jgi:hypothetical protein
LGDPYQSFDIQVPACSRKNHLYHNQLTSPIHGRCFPPRQINSKPAILSLSKQRLALEGFLISDKIGFVILNACLGKFIVKLDFVSQEFNHPTKSDSILFY